MPVPTFLEALAAAFFVLALVHTFAASAVRQLARRFPAHGRLLHLLGEVEVVFGLWAVALVVAIAAFGSGHAALQYAESRRYTEPVFVLVVMVVAASRPVVECAVRATRGLAGAVPLRRELVAAWLGLAAIPLLGSLVTEPAAMTVAALVLRPIVFRKDVPARPKYLALGALFVNISIGGTLTSYAAPPVLMVAAAWGWDSAFMALNFGWKAALAVGVNATLAVLLLRPHLQPLAMQEEAKPVPIGVALVHLVFLVAVVLLAHHPVAFTAVFLLFLGFVHAYEQHQHPLVLREALLVAVFLAGLVVLGGMQQWWLQPVVTALGSETLFWGAAALTAVTDNAALTYLGSLVQGLPEASRYALVAGAVAGGGLTVVANAPNPAGVALLRRGFDAERVGVGPLALGALVPTAVALAAFRLL
ncbi:putative Na+/H+ antiporter [Ramlibacter albus]|uniref:Na+/H+ antiporter n=1 Tax=Ramlibacter albus TaxID=2079448 RepID=A0A923M873_9BURK|nr:putative Na+/H+ antiporter [Ramlibacter albus]MBC5764683.1 putative Na+/H+ antiporter [Ramlibacter albus]